MTVFGLVVAAAGLVWALGAPEARAHALESSLEAVPGHNQTLLLHSQFSSGEPAADAEVTLLAPGRDPIVLGRTDASGQLRFVRPQATLQARAADWELRIDDGPGHRDYLELPAAPDSPTAKALASLPQAWPGWAGPTMALIGVLALRKPLLRR